MKISDNYVMVERAERPKKEGDFEVVDVQDDYVYRGKVVLLPERPVFIGNDHIAVGDIILFAKYSPDTHELEVEGKKIKMVRAADILAVE